MTRTDSLGELLERGRTAAARGAWREAYDVLAAVDSAELSPEDLELIGEATSWTGPTEQCIEVRERAFSAYLESGDRKSAARHGEAVPTRRPGRSSSPMCADRRA
jgi:hypothetical protein